MQGERKAAPRPSCLANPPLRASAAHLYRLFLPFRSWSAYAFDNLAYLYTRAFVFDHGVSSCVSAGRSVSAAG